MDRLEANFHSDCTGMHAQLAGLAALVRLLDPQLTAFLARREATTFFFCYRWLLIHFKREFAFDEARGPARRAACCRLGPPRRGAAACRAAWSRPRGAPGRPADRLKTLAFKLAALGTAGTRACHAPPYLMPRHARARGRCCGCGRRCGRAR